MNAHLDLLDSGPYVPVSRYSMAAHHLQGYVAHQLTSGSYGPLNFSTGQSMHCPCDYQGFQNNRIGFSVENILSPSSGNITSSPNHVGHNNDDSLPMGSPQRSSGKCTPISLIFIEKQQQCIFFCFIFLLFFLRGGDMHHARKNK